ncbi:hypothetical protein [Spirosoma telluris]|uniref:hypothetical protein n=1 Tax=Spirosoma telluris TaxID=2183553 RepID=UPI0018F60B94
MESVSIGNGEFAFTVDPTGLQTFPEVYQQGFRSVRNHSGDGIAFRIPRNIALRKFTKIISHMVAMCPIRIHTPSLSAKKLRLTGSGKSTSTPSGSDRFWARQSRWFGSEAAGLAEYSSGT